MKCMSVCVFVCMYVGYSGLKFLVDFGLIMQEALQRLGFYSGEEDMEYSSFSSGTEKAVKTWQVSDLLFLQNPNLRTN